MTPVAMITMAAICGTVWGGFAGLLWLAVRRERGKRSVPKVD